MTGLSIQNNYALNPLDSVTGGSSNGGLSTQQIEQIIEELLAACQSLLSASDSNDISPAQGTGSSSAPSNFNTSPANSIDPASGNGSTGGLSMQQIEQIIQELIAAFQNILPGSDDGSMSSPQGVGGGGGGSPSNFNTNPQSAQSAPGGAPGGAPSGSSNPPPPSNPPGGSPSGAPSGSSNPPPPASNPPGGSPSSAPGLTNNAGGVAQAGAVNGVSSASTQTMNTGTGNDKTFNVTNNTNRTESFTYSVQGANKATMTLAPGQTGTFTAGSGDIGVRISPSDANGNTHPDEVLYEDGGAGNGQAAGAGNPDISKVDGNKDFAGNAENMTVTLSDGRTAGDGDAIHAYQYPTDDAASMGLAGDTSKTVNVVMSDAT